MEVIQQTVPYVLWTAAAVLVLIVLTGGFRKCAECKSRLTYIAEAEEVFQPGEIFVDQFRVCGRCGFRLPLGTVKMFRVPPEA
jgi:hypothetical protein